MITEEEVYIYRELYYETVKPLLMAGASQDFIKEMLTDACKKFGWTHDKYQTFSSIDFMQRMARLSIRSASENRLLVKTAEGKGIEYHATLNMQELRCPRRSEDKD